MTAPPPRIILPFTAPARRAVRVVNVVQVALIGVLIGNLGRIPVFSTGERQAPILVNDLFVAMILGIGALNSLQKRSLVLDRVALWALTFAAIGGLSTLLSIPRFGLTPFEVAVSLSYLARWLFYFGVYVVAINALSDDDVDRTWRMVETTVLIFAAFGIVQSLMLPGFAQLVYPESRVVADWDPQGHRLVSTWLDPVFAGAFIMIGLLIQMGRIAMGARVATWKPALLTVALLLTASRAALLGLIAGMAIILVARGLSKRMFRVTIALGALLLVGIPAALAFTGLFSKLQIDDSAMIRVVGWLRAIRVLAEHSVIGVGFNAWGFVQERYGYERNYTFSYSLDGGLLFIALMTGLVGLAAYVAMIGAMTTRARRLWRDATARVGDRGLAVGTVASTAAILVNACFANSLMYPFLVEVMWILWALVFVAHRRWLPASNPSNRPVFVTTPGLESAGAPGSHPS